MLASGCGSCSVAAHRSRGSGLKVTSINQKRGLELQSISTEDPETSVVWRQEELDEVISSIKCGYHENTACPTVTEMLLCGASVTSTQWA